MATVTETPTARNPKAYHCSYLNLSGILVKPADAVCSSRPKAARLERLAQLVRVSPVQDEAVFEAAYAEVGKLSQAMQAIWQPLATWRH